VIAAPKGEAMEVNHPIMDCKDIKALLSAIVDGELDHQTQHEAERHLADCAACRDVVNEAEALNNFIALDAQRMMWPVGLPAGFEQAVLRQTVYAEAYEFAGRRWTSWLGWVAAAASLMLAVSVWFVSKQTAAPTYTPIIAQAPTNPVAAPARAVAYPVSGRSWTYEGGLPANSLRVSAGTTDDFNASSTASSHGAVMQASMWREADADPISRDDADTLYAASNLLGMLNNSDLDSFRDIERIRQIAEYDELLDRLAESRTRLTPADRAVVLAAESVLLRVVNGPLSVEDLHLLNETVASLDLPTQVEAISHRGLQWSSL
jgi:predicted anti-sigma-YlaC factor YlaD